MTVIVYSLFHGFSHHFGFASASSFICLCLLWLESNDSHHIVVALSTLTSLLYKQTNQSVIQPVMSQLDQPASRQQPKRWRGIGSEEDTV